MLAARTILFKPVPKQHPNTDLAKGTLNVDSKKTCDTYRISRLFNGERTNFRVIFSYVTGPSTDISGGCGSIAI